MADQYLGTPVTAFLVLTILTWAAVTVVSGTTQELFTTAGDTVNIPCPFGEGTLHYILIEWYSNDRQRRILELANGGITIEAEYESRASMQDDYSTLNLTDITVADEGTYRCVVDTRKETAPSNIETKLNVFNLRPDTLPVITNCTLVDDSSSCSIHANQPFTLICTLPNVYPVKDTELIWYKDGKHFSSIHDVTQNDDETTNIIRQIKIYETGYFTCNATYNSATGKENTAVAVEAWIIPPTDVPNTPGKNMTSIPIAWKTISIVLLAGISMAIIARFLYLKARGQRSSRKDRNKSDDTEIYQEATELRSILVGNGSKDENAQSSEPTGRPQANHSRSKEEELTPLVAPDENGSKDENAQSSEPTGRPKANHARSKEEELPLLGTSEENDSKNKNEESTLLGTSEENDSQDENEELPLLGTSKENDSKDENESSDPTKRPTAEHSKNIKEDSTLLGTSEENESQDENEESTLLGTSEENGSQDDNVDFSASLPSFTLRRRNVKRVEDETLSELAEALAVDMDVRMLGIELGFRRAKVDMYMSINKMNDSFEGTTAMLFDWNRKTTRARRIPDLVQALSDSGLMEFADEFFPEEAARQQEKPFTSASNVGS